jgi:uncharacterized membrane protein
MYLTAIISDWWGILLGIISILAIYLIIYTLELIQDHLPSKEKSEKS